ncbi:hypothetical protein HanPI659440_Chr17g0667901 [Helianthus annuus]|nr:hypothetical protein HanPI659440_Chr17g0667901 [Helianthus annuus]
MHLSSLYKGLKYVHLKLAHLELWLKTLWSSSGHQLIFLGSIILLRTLVSALNPP